MLDKIQMYMTTTYYIQLDWNQRNVMDNLDSKVLITVMVLR